MKVAVFADLHLDTQFTWAPPDVAHRRRLRLRQVMTKMLSIAAEENVRAVLCGGDLYEQDNFEPDTGEFIRQACRSIAPIPVFFAPGNHDWLGPASLYAQVDWPTNVHIFDTDRLSRYEIEDGVSLWGAAHCAPANTDGFLDDFRVDAGGVNLALFHGSEQSGLFAQGEGKKPHEPFRQEQIAAAGLDFAFVGRWADFDERAATIAVAGKVVRVAGKGLVRVAETKTAAGRRTIPLPRFAVDMLRNRRGLPFLGEQSVIFPSASGALRDPDSFNAHWRQVRDELGVPGVSSHSFRKTLATLIDDGGLSARIGADHLGHSQVSMTQDRYMARGRVHTQVADLMDRTVTRVNESHES